MKSKLDTICEYLINNDIDDYEILDHDAVKSMSDVFRVICAKPAQMIKAVLLKINHDGIRYLLLGIPADQLVNFEIMANLLNVSKNRISLASRNDVKEVMDCEPGALPPFSLNYKKVSFIIDSSFAKYEYVYCGAGTFFHTLKIKATELKKLPGFNEKKLIRDD